MNPIVSARWVTRLAHLMGLACLLLAVDVWLHPQAPPYRGRIAWIAELLFWWFGPVGPALMYAAGGVSFIMVGRAIWRHTPKLPTDRWL